MARHIDIHLAGPEKEVDECSGDHQLDDGGRVAEYVYVAQRCCRKEVGVSAEIRAEGGGGGV